MSMMYIALQSHVLGIKLFNFNNYIKIVIIMIRNNDNNEDDDNNNNDNDNND